MLVASSITQSKQGAPPRTGEGPLIRFKSKRWLDITVAAASFPFAILFGFPFALVVWLEDRHGPIYAGPPVGKNWKPFRHSSKYGRWLPTLSRAALNLLRPTMHGLRASGTPYGE